MVISAEIIGIYIGMVIFGLFAYAYIIPYFVIRRFKKLMADGEIGAMLGTALTAELIVHDAQGNEHKTQVGNYLVSLAVQNLKLQLNSMKSAFIRSMISDGGEDGTSQFLESVPKNWRWAAQLMLPIIASKMQQGQQAQQGQPQQQQQINHGGKPTLWG